MHLLNLVRYCDYFVSRILVRSSVNSVCAEL